MATESYGRTDDGIAWEVRHELWSGPWRWTMWLPDGRRVESPKRYETERQALNAVEDARRQVLAGLPPVETMASLRARAEAAEARAAQAEADARLMLAERYYADECGIFDDRLPLDECKAVSGMARAYVSTPQAAWVEAVRRILATAGST
jgi:hypothetical protein